MSALNDAGVNVTRRSRWYRSAPVPPSPQPWFVNGVAAVETALGPVDLLTQLHEIERRFGPPREVRGEPRSLDLDLLDYRGMLRPGAPPPELPHPRLAERAFVLLPLAEIAPGWRHPRIDRTVESLLAALPAGQAIEVIA